MTFERTVISALLIVICRVVKLVKNFRSHNAILKFPNEQFYKGELEQCADPKVINSYIGSPHLVSKKFPIIFHAISGKDDREASSPSFFNIDEASLVKEYVRALRSDKKYHIGMCSIDVLRLWACTEFPTPADDEIGVITPYHAQCLKIRNILRAVADGVKVGSVEEFQGQVSCH
jgi:helicase MOV-10